jgi:hypothetical protein
MNAPKWKTHVQHLKSNCRLLPLCTSPRMCTIDCWTRISDLKQNVPKGCWQTTPGQLTRKIGHQSLYVNRVNYVIPNLALSSQRRGDCGLRGGTNGRWSKSSLAVCINPREGRVPKLMTCLCVCAPCRAVPLLYFCIFAYF